MFVEYSTVVDVGIAEVEKRLDRIRRGLDSPVDVIYQHGDGLVARVGPTTTVSRKVTLDIGAGHIHKTGLVYPVHWAARSAETLFPELTADLVLSQEGQARTRLTLKGTYQPPLGRLGRLADRAVMSRVAEATVADWMDRLASGLSLG